MKNISIKKQKLLNSNIRRNNKTKIIIIINNIKKFINHQSFNIKEKDPVHHNFKRKETINLKIKDFQVFYLILTFHYLSFAI
jgi:translation initiation factor IF-2